MSDEVLKGQETELRFTQNGSHIDSIAEVKDFEITYGMSIISQGYVGETTDRKDDIFNGMRGRATLHISRGQLFSLFDDIVGRARRIAGKKGMRISATTILNIGDGQKTLFFKDLKFGEIPVNVGGRAEYVNVTVDWECSDQPDIT